jgi:hypothetical protein
MDHPDPGTGPSDKRATKPTGATELTGAPKPTAATDPQEGSDRPSRGVSQVP